MNSHSLRTSSSYEVSGGNDDDMRVGVQIVDNSRSFLHDRSKVSGFGDVMGRMAATPTADGSSSDDQARCLLNRFLGAQVLLTGVESMMANGPGEARTSQTVTTKLSSSSSNARRSPKNAPVKEAAGETVLVNGVDISSEQDEQKLKSL
ncbi:uncharacterized protein LOC108668019, partial [Hyalella azteca]|uniref:Uncharacterized protein LOC108668019 n=1 Tax=Hyalella azteca TaxID=294128 RepID=A0A8B7NAL9_HYAAZ